MGKNPGSLVISLDFELLWGVFDKVEWTTRIDYFNNTRKVIPQILELFETYGIGCTWATVGMLFNSDWDDWNANHPEILPDYEDRSLSAYAFGKKIQSRETENLCFAPDIIDRILSVPNQEIASHTYSHYYCKEPGQSVNSFKADLLKAQEVARKLGVEVTSLVFPRNQINRDYLASCRDLVITSVRSNPDSWYWKDIQKNTIVQKLFRTGDAYFGFNDKSVKWGDIKSFKDIQLQPASRLLRPYSGNAVLDRLRLKRIIKEMEYAAKNNLLYHLWWHPHNFGANPDKNIQELNLILTFFNKLENKFGFKSLTMNQVEKLLRRDKSE